MIFWFIIAGIAIAVAAILVRAVLLGRTGSVSPAAFDLQVYRDQLKEVDRDLARGILAEDEAERLRIEVSRRILAADAQVKAESETSGRPRPVGWAVAGVAAVVLMGGALVLYSGLGAPGYDDLPIKARIAHSDELRANRLSQAAAEARLPEHTPLTDVSEEYMELIKKLRETVRQRPDDLQGLTLLVRNEAGMANYTPAYEAQSKIIALKGDKAPASDYTYLAELLITSAGGYVSQEAETALREALKRAPQDPIARYYQAQYMMQVDRPDAAFRTLEKLLNDSPPDAPWVKAVRGQIEEVAWRAGAKFELPPAQEGLSGPSAEDMQAAQDMSDEDRQEMIRGMVSRLSERLAAEGGPPEEWARLIRALGVLGETDRARAIYTESRQVFAQSPEALAELRAAAQAGGVAE